MIGVYYHNSGNKHKAIEFFERALDYNPNDYWPNFNLGNTLIYQDPKRARKYLEKAYELNPSEPCVNILLGRIDKSEGKTEEAKAKFQIAFDVYERRWRANSLSRSDYGWFASVAEELGKHDKAFEIRSAKPRMEQTAYYDAENLTQTRTKSLTHN